MSEPAKMLRPIVCGGRDFADRDFVWNELTRLDAEFGPFACIIHGAARGVDSEAMIWAQANSRLHAPCKPEYKRYEPKIAPLMRNQRMIDEYRPDGCIAFPGGNGTADMKRRAIKAGLRVIECAP